MGYFKSLKFNIKKLFSILTLLITSCTPPISPWKIDRVIAADPRWNSTRFIYTENSSKFELYQNSRKEFSGYFSVTSLPIPSLPDNPSMSCLTLIIDNKKEQVLVYRITGGQRLVIPENILNNILFSLKKGSSIILKTGRYTLSLPPCPAI